MNKEIMDAYGYLNTRLGGHQAYASKVIDILEEEYVICKKQELEFLLKRAGLQGDELKKLISDIESLKSGL